MSLRNRVLTFLLGLMLLIQIVTLYLADAASNRNANTLVGESLVTTMQSFYNSINSRNEALTLAGRTLSGDYAFKIAYATTGPQTVKSALTNYRYRFGTDLMLILDLDGNNQILSGIEPGPSMQYGEPFPFPDFLQTLEEDGQASGIIHYNNRLYSITAVPLLTPVPAAWIVIGYEVNGDFVQHVQQEDTTRITLVYDKAGSRTIHVSTLPAEHQLQAEKAINTGGWSLESGYEMRLGQSTYITYVSHLPSWGGINAYTMMQRDMGETRAPYFQIRILLITITLLALLLSIF